MTTDTPKVTGIGGIFFRSKNPKTLREWYGKHLGLAIDNYGSPFEFRNADRPDEINYLRWAPFDEGTKDYIPDDKQLMINYRVSDMDGLVGRMRSNGVRFLDSVKNYDYGKFLHIMDEDGNKIELWEPVDSFLTQLGGATSKVVGIGGVFFKCKDPEKTKTWYRTNLGMNTDQYGASLPWRGGADSSREAITQWSPFSQTTKYFAPSTKDFMINYCVSGLEALVAKLQRDGVTIVDKLEATDYGKFIHIMDPEGNKIELWEPVGW